MEREKLETQIDLGRRLNSLIYSASQGVQGLDPLIEDVIKQIMEKNGIKPETRDKFVDQ